MPPIAIPGRRHSDGVPGRLDGQQTGRRHVAAGAPDGVARQPFGVGMVQDSKTQLLRDKPPARPLRVNGEPRSEHMPVLLGHLAEAIEGRPGALGVHVVGRHGRHPAPVVDPGVEQGREVLGQVRGSLDVDVGGEQDASGGDRPEMLLRWARGGGVHGGPSLREEVLDDHLLHVAMAGVAGRDRFAGPPAGRRASRRCRRGSRS